MAYATSGRDLVCLSGSKDWLLEIQEMSVRLVKAFQSCESIMALVIACIL